jgi:hypothetical protein
LTVIASEGDNRTFKTGTLALLGWLFYLNNASVPQILNGIRIPKRILSCCKLTPNGDFQHTFNFPHEDILFSDLAEADLYDCCVLTDELDSLADSRLPWDKRIINAGNFNFQVKKSDVTWLWTAVVHDTIDKRIRRNPDFIIENHREPKDWRKPLQKVIWKIWNRYGGESPPRTINIDQPWRCFPLWNTKQKIPHLYQQFKIPSTIDDKKLFQEIIR